MLNDCIIIFYPDIHNINFLNLLTYKSAKIMSLPLLHIADI